MFLSMPHRRPDLARDSWTCTRCHRRRFNRLESHHVVFQNFLLPHSLRKLRFTIGRRNRLKSSQLFTPLIHIIGVRPNIGVERCLIGPKLNGFCAVFGTMGQEVGRTILGLRLFGVADAQARRGVCACSFAIVRIA